MTDWSLVNDGVLVIEWLAETENIENSEKTIINLWLEKFKDKYGGAKIFNKGALLMASYLFFVYIKEQEYRNFDFSKVDYSNFEILVQEKSHDLGVKLTNRLRNSISHSRFKFEGEDIVFEDMKSDGSDYIKFRIDAVQFGVFLTNFLIETKKQLMI